MEKRKPYFAPYTPLCLHVVVEWGAEQGFALFILIRCGLLSRYAPHFVTGIVGHE